MPKQQSNSRRAAPRGEHLQVAADGLQVVGAAVIAAGAEKKLVRQLLHQPLLQTCAEGIRHMKTAACEPTVPDGPRRRGINRLQCDPHVHLPPGC